MMSLASLKIGETTIVIADNVWEGHPDQLVPNPNPRGQNKYITRKAAQHWLVQNGHPRPHSGKSQHKPHPQPSL